MLTHETKTWHLNFSHASNAFKSMHARSSSGLFPAKDLLEFVENPGAIRNKREQGEKVQNAIKKLQSYEEISAIINTYLTSSRDVYDVCRLYSAQFRPDSGQEKVGENAGWW